MGPLYKICSVSLQKFIRAAEGTYFNTINQIGERSESNNMGKLMGYGNWYWHQFCNFTLIYSVSYFLYRGPDIRVTEIFSRMKMHGLYTISSICLMMHHHIL